MIIQRRNFLIGLASSLAAPAIVRATSIMPVKALIAIPEIHFTQLEIIYEFVEVKPEWFDFIGTIEWTKAEIEQITAKDMFNL